jgi:integrase
MDLQRLPQNCGKNELPQIKLPACIECGSQKVWKDGNRYNGNVEVQRYLCRVCGYRFSEPVVEFNVVSQDRKLLDSSSDLTEEMVSNRKISIKKSVDSLPFFSSEEVGSHISKDHRITTVGKDLYSFPSDRSLSQVGVSTKEAKNLDTATETKTVAGGKANLKEDTTDPTVKGKLLAYEFWMQKQNLSSETIRLNRTCLNMLIRNGANLLDPESTKEALNKYKASPSRKRNAINAYTQFLKLSNMTWEKPKCIITKKFPFIPTEKELDDLIAGSGKKNAAFLQLLKDTAMRSGEAKRLKWTDIDFEKNIITLNDPEKGSNPRMWKANAKLMIMLSLLPRTSQRLFGDGPINSQKTTFTKTRKALAMKLGNPRLLRISFHTFRHWKATQLYHETKDPYYVKDFLGHKELRNTEIYINIERTIFQSSTDGFTVKVTESAEEVKSLLEVGFEYVCQKDNLIFLRKRK